MCSEIRYKYKKEVFSATPHIYSFLRQCIFKNKKNNYLKNNPFFENYFIKSLLLFNESE